MIKNLIHKLIGKPAPKAALGRRVEVPHTVHHINPKLIDPRASEVVHTLKQGGYEAYIVGGAVRDLLLGLRPKDFDVATNATPEQVKQLFRRAFIIGRRFRIVHVVFGRGRQDRGLSEVIEVSTFRAHLDSSEATTVVGNESNTRHLSNHTRHAVGSSGRVLRDNVWGTQAEDAARRDFSINALYYDPEKRIVVDYHHGIKDIQKKTLRLIGDPLTRYTEDPVRMLRAVRFVAKLDHLGFKLERKTAAPITEVLDLLQDVPPSRLFDETLKLLQTGHASASIAQLRKLKVQQGISPLLDLVVQRADQPLVALALQDTDRRVSEDKPVAPSFLLACVLWSDVYPHWQKEMAHGQRDVPALQTAIDTVFDAGLIDISGRGRLSTDMREIWLMQPRFSKRTGSAPFSLVEQPRFRAAIDFLRLRTEIKETSDELLAWWEDFYLVDDAAREDLVQQAREAEREAAKTAGTAAPAKKKRRRRKPSGNAKGTGSGTGAGSDTSSDA